MCETPKDDVAEPGKQPKDPPKSYYYDDAHGYEDFEPESEDSDEEDEEDDLT